MKQNLLPFKTKAKDNIIEYSSQYESALARNEYLVCSKVFQSKPYYIITFETGNYLHLTGVNSRLKAEEFFSKCINKSLTEDDFDFKKYGQTERAVKGSVRRKLKVFPKMLEFFNGSVLYVEEPFEKNHVSCTIGTSDGTCTVGFIDQNGAKPKSLMDGNCLTSKCSIDVILKRKKNTDFFDWFIFGDIEKLREYKEDVWHILHSELQKML